MTLNIGTNFSRSRRFTFDLDRNLKAETGLSCGIRHNGSIQLEACDGQMDFLRLMRSRARYPKMWPEPMSVTKAKRRHVLITGEVFQGALWREKGGQVDPWLISQGDTPALAMANVCVPVVDGDRVVYSDAVDSIEPYAHLAMNAGPRIIASVLAADASAVSEIDLGTMVDELAARRTVLSIVNVNSSWWVNEDILDDIMSHSHLINHAAGCLEGGLSASVERAILATPPGGYSFGSPHTLLRYKNVSWRSRLAGWSNFENRRDAGARDATVRAAEVWAQTISSAESPAPAPAPAPATAPDAVLGAYGAARKNEGGA